MAPCEYWVLSLFLALQWACSVGLKFYNHQWWIKLILLVASLPCASCASTFSSFWHSAQLEGVMKTTLTSTVNFTAIRVVASFSPSFISSEFHIYPWFFALLPFIDLRTDPLVQLQDTTRNLYMFVNPYLLRSIQLRSPLPLSLVLRAPRLSP